MPTIKRRWLGFRYITWLLAMAVFLQLLVTTIYIVSPAKLQVFTTTNSASIPNPMNRHNNNNNNNNNDNNNNNRVVQSVTKQSRKDKGTKLPQSTRGQTRKTPPKDPPKAMPIIKLPDEFFEEVNETRKIRTKSRSPRRWPVPKHPGKIPEEWLKLAENTGQCSQCPFKEKHGIFCLQDDTEQYAGDIANASCLLEGTDWNTTTPNHTYCSCKPGWRGPTCSVPESVYRSDLSVYYKNSLTLRANPRRIIYSFPFHMEFALLEARIAEFADLVDVFLVLESNYTAYGEAKRLDLLARLQIGAYPDIACKIVYVFLDHFPEDAYYEGNLADRLHRDHIGTQGVAKQLRNYRPDDIFMLTDADEIPKRETILFLKVHDGYPEPFGFYYRWNVFGFFWTPGLPTHVDVGMTMGMLTRVVGLPNTSLVKFYSTRLFDYNPTMNNYIRSVPSRSIRHWDFGNFVHHAGWHCSWCFPPEDIRDKLMSAQNGDFPRWGDNPEKLDVDYIKTLIQNGVWFNDRDKFKTTRIQDKNYAPSHFLKNPQRYELMLNNAYKQDNQSLINT